MSAKNTIQPHRKPFLDSNRSVLKNDLGDPAAGARSSHSSRVHSSSYYPPSLSETTRAMGCSSSKSKKYADGPQTGRYNEPNYSDLTTNVNNGGFSANYNGNGAHQNRRPPAPALRNGGRKDLGASSAGSRTDSEICFPDLVKFRLDESEVLLTRKVSSGAFGVVWLGHYHGQPVAVKRMIDGEDEAVESVVQMLNDARVQLQAMS
ncbi:hypothetical protein PRNP1_001711 [Phytophthora ramorum]